MKLRNIFWLVIIIIFFVAAYRVASRIETSKKILSDKIIPITVQKPMTGTIEEKLELTGDVKAESEVQVRPRAAGRVEEIYVEEGDFVVKGQKMLSYVAGIKKDNELYDDMVVSAPISGVVGIQLVKVGEQVTSSVGNINPVFMIYKIDSLKIFADVPEKYYSFIHEGTLAEIALDSYPGEIFHGLIRNVRPVVDPMSRTTQIEIRMQNPGRKIKPGMFAKVNIILRQKVHAIIIPFDSVLGDTQKFVYVSDNGKAVRKNITVGILQDDSVEIISGLLTSESIIIEGQRVVKNGSKVEEIKQ